MHSNRSLFFQLRRIGITALFNCIFAVALVQLSASAHADAFRCRSNTGQIVYSNLPCGETHKTTNAVSTESIDEMNLKQANSELERQKQWLRQREQAQQIQSTPVQAATVKRPTGDAYDQSGRDRIHTCLMAVTAKIGLSAYEAGQRRVNCYQGTYGLRDECEMRVTGTGGLTSNQENNLRQQCKNLSG